jgi:predicted DsbA family dithiol-disulfide isomerase
MAEQEIATENPSHSHFHRGKTVRVWSDFVCPYCMLADEVLQDAAQGLDIEIVWEPFELRPYPAPTLKPEDEYLPDVWKHSVYPLAEHLKVPISLPTISPQPYTRLAFIGFQYAREQGRGNAYVQAVFRAFFQKNLDIGKKEVLLDIAHEAGLNRLTFAEALESASYAAKHDRALQDARAFDVTAVPVILVGEQKFVGLPEKQALRRALEQFQAGSIKEQS